MPVRRHHFAASFVLVFGCSGSPRELPPGATTVSAEEMASIAPDAAVPVDAAPEPRRVRACGPGSTCNPPHTRRPPLDAGPPPVAGQRAAIIHAQRDGERTWIMINRGTDVGLQNGTDGVLVGADGAAVPGSNFVLEQCKPRSCKAPVDLPLDAVMESSREVALP